MDDRVPVLRRELAERLRQAAELKVALDRADGTIRGVAHYTLIEEAAEEVAREVSRLVQQRHMAEVAAEHVGAVRCPDCGTRCATEVKRKRRTSVAGPVELAEPTARGVGGIFFPLRETLGFDSRQYTPAVIRRVTVTAAETRSFHRATIVLKEHELTISPKSVERLVHDVGGELAQRRDADAKSLEALASRPEEPPELAVVECDGGRIRCRQPGHGPGVHRTGEGWREDKNACLIRAQGKTFQDDPHPEPPECFCDPHHVAKVAETEALSLAAPLAGVATGEAPEVVEPPPEDWRPKRLVRTVLSSVAEAKVFGKQMVREARRRRFFEARGKAFLGDGLAWNWSIHQGHFRQFTPILDFIHALSYLFVLAKALHTAAEDAWSQYLAWMRGCWQGEVAQVLEELRHWQDRLGPAPRDASEQDPRKLLAKTITYLKHNQGRMRYPEYRRAGLPVTTAWMESLVKEINYRAKGTEMFWNDPQGAEAILQVRAAALCEDGRLRKHLRTRPSYPFTRRPKPTKSPREKIKS